MGSAAEDKIKSIEQAMINSSSVMPASERKRLWDRPFIRM